MHYFPSKPKVLVACFWQVRCDVLMKKYVSCYLKVDVKSGQSAIILVHKGDATITFAC